MPDGGKELSCRGGSLATRKRSLGMLITSRQRVGDRLMLMVVQKMNAPSR